MKFIISFIVLFTINYSFAQNSRIQDPVKNFDILWNEFNNRYANFELKHIDWNDIYKKYRPLINEKTTNDSLFTICNKMLLELKDGHVTLVQYGTNKKIIRESEGGSPLTLLEKFPISKNKEPNIFQLIEITDKTLKNYAFSNSISSKKRKIEYSNSKQYGYLRIIQMLGLSMNQYKMHIDNAIKTFKNKNGVIIDIRFNGGGHDKVSFAIASRFADKKRVGHYKKERKKGTTEFKKIKTRYLEPDGNKQFTKPIVILTSDVTASAAEIFTMIMKELPYVTIIGDNTQGVFSDRYEFKLPNRWRVSLSHQQYFSADMKNYEGVGIEPHIRMLNEQADIKNGIDPLIIKALELLNEKNNR